MNLQNVRWPALVVSVGITLAALFGAGFALKARTVDEPLKTAFAGSPAVESFSVNRQADQYEITVVMKNVPDMAGSYAAFNEETHKVLKDQKYTIKVQDHRTPELEQTFRHVNLYVQEALATGKFASMAQLVEQEASKAGVSARLSVDHDRVYVHLEQNGAYLYSIEERRPAASVIGEGGGTL